MQPFHYVVPRDFAEASALLAEGSSAVRPLQGGTDLLIRLRSGGIQPQRVVDLKGLPRMREIWQASDGSLVIGAACTMNQVALHPVVRGHYDLLAQACNSVASYQLRNRATVGGNCCNASPAADTAPALYCLEAQAEIFGPAGTRYIPIHEFFAGPGRTALRTGELLVALHLPPAVPPSWGVFNKLGRTRLGDISIVTVAVHVVEASAHDATRRQAGGGRWRIALGAVGPTPLRAEEAEAALAADSSPAGVGSAAELAAAAARPISDIRAGAAYRRAMVRVLTRRGIEAVLQRRAAEPAAGGAAA